MKRTVFGLIGCLMTASTAFAATIELSGGGPDVAVMLRVPVPAGYLNARPGQVVALTDENGREMPAQVEPAGLDGDALELVFVRPEGMGKKLRVGDASPTSQGRYSAKKDGDRTVTLGVGDKTIAVYHVGVRTLPAHPEFNRPNFFHPLVTPSGVTVTDDAPADHLHHRGLFMAFTQLTWTRGDKKLEDNFWHKFEKASIAPGRLAYARGGPTCATLAVSHDYMIGDQVVLVQDVVARAAALSDRVNLLDVDYRITPKDGDVELGENFYSCLQLRGAADYNRPDLIYTYADGKPHRDVDKRKDAPPELPPFDRWFDQTGPIKDKSAGAAIAIHPETPKSRLCYAQGVKGLNVDFLFDGPMKVPRREDGPLPLPGLHPRRHGRRGQGRTDRRLVQSRLRGEVEQVGCSEPEPVGLSLLGSSRGRRRSPNFLHCSGRGPCGLRR